MWSWASVAQRTALSIIYILISLNAGERATWRWPPVMGSHRKKCFFFRLRTKTRPWGQGEVCRRGCGPANPAWE
uniref:Uncharacterized protein n=1 Tax=Arundo donax TaxID=35708 RepID=A0A0A9GMN3_ARUDO